MGILAAVKEVAVVNDEFKLDGYGIVGDLFEVVPEFIKGFE